jgi:hypothetical protein
VLGKTHTGQPAVMIGRGGHHDVPEGPSGLSLVSLAKGSEGKTIWKADIPGKALYNMHWNRDRAYWLDEDTGAHRVLDSRTGKEIAVHKLGENATVRSYDKASKRYVTEQNVNIKAKGFRVFPAWFSNIVVGDWHWFLCFSSIRAEYGGGPVGPLYSVGRVNTKTGATEYLELPTAPGVYGTNVEANWRVIKNFDYLLRAAPHGRAVFMTSGAGSRARMAAGRGAYALSKTALDALVRSYASEVDETRMRVMLCNALRSTGTRTQLTLSPCS